MRTPRLALLATLLAAAAAADTISRLAGPVLGYVHDPRLQAVRPVNGMPGAAHLGAPLALPFAVTAAAFSSRSDFGVLVSADGEVFLLSDPVPATAAPLGGALRNPDLLTLNSLDSAAALYSSATRQFQIIRGLPANPSFGPILEMAEIPGPVVALALTRDASHALLAARGGVYDVDVTPDGAATPRLVAALGAPAALAVVNRDQDVVVADAELNQLVLVREFARTAELSALAGERDGISNPVGLAASADGRRLYVASAAARSLDVLDLATMAAEARLALDWVPTRLVRLQGDTVFLLNGVGSDPLLLLDTVGPPGVYFVPAVEER